MEALMDMLVVANMAADVVLKLFIALLLTVVAVVLYDWGRRE